MYHKRSIFCKVLGDIIKWTVKIALSVSEIATISTVSKLRNVKKKFEVKRAIWFVERFFVVHVSVLIWPFKKIMETELLSAEQ